MAFSASERRLAIAVASCPIPAASGPQRPPGLVWQSAALNTQAVICDGTSTAPSSTSKANGQAGTSTSNRSSPSGRPTPVAMIGFSPTMSTMQRWEGSDTLSPASRNFSTCRLWPLPDTCRRPASPLRSSGFPSILAGSGAGTFAAFALDAAPAFLGLAVAGAPAEAAGAAPGRTSCAGAALAQRTKPQARIETRQVVGQIMGKL